MDERDGEIALLRAEIAQLRRGLESFKTTVRGNLINPLERVFPVVPLHQSDAAVAFMYFAMGIRIAPFFVFLDLVVRSVMIFLGSRSPCFINSVFRTAIYIMDSMELFVALKITQRVFDPLMPRFGAIEFVVAWMSGYFTHPLIAMPALVYCIIAGYVDMNLLVSAIAMGAPIVSSREFRKPDYPFRLACALLFGCALLQHEMFVDLTDVLRIAPEGPSSDARAFSSPSPPPPSSSNPASG